MEKSDVFKQLQLIACNIAQKMGYSTLAISKRRHHNFWWSDFASFLDKQDNGYYSGDIKWCDSQNDNNYVEFRWRFGNPVVGVRYRNSSDDEVLASLEFTNTKYVEDGVYEEDTCFNKKGDIKYKPVIIPWKLSQIQLWEYNESHPIFLEIKNMFEKFIKNE